jgi:hypothetical protein
MTGVSGQGQARQAKCTPLEVRRGFVNPSQSGAWRRAIPGVLAGAAPSVRRGCCYDNSCYDNIHAAQSYPRGRSTKAGSADELTGPTTKLACGGADGLPAREMLTLRLVAAALRHQSNRADGRSERGTG